jgi:hypothetical protein
MGQSRSKDHKKKDASRRKTLHRAMAHVKIADDARDTAFDIAVANRFGVPAGEPGKVKAPPAPQGTSRKIINESVERAKGEFARQTSRRDSAAARVRELTAKSKRKGKK